MNFRRVPKEMFKGKGERKEFKIIRQGDPRIFLDIKIFLSPILIQAPFFRIFLIV